MVMTESSDFTTYGMEPHTVEEVFRASPEPGSYYRCPVSTPLHASKRPRQKIPESLTFVSLDFSKVEESRKPNLLNRGMPAGKKLLPRRKNMDYYYIDKKFQKRIAAQSNTTWLRSLCAQPVDEIFVKYRQLSEVKQQQQSAMLTRSYTTTPGEQAIMDAWETNSTKRQQSACSRSSLNSRATEATVSPQLTVVSKPYRKVQSNTEHGQRPNSRADISSQQSPGGSGFQTPVVSRSTPVCDSPLMVQKPSRDSSLESLCLIPVPDKTSNDAAPTVDNDYYDQFKRQSPKLPNVYNYRRRKIMTIGNQNVYTYSQPSPTAYSPVNSPRKFSELSASANTLFEIRENEKD